MSIESQDKVQYNADRIQQQGDELPKNYKEVNHVDSTMA